MSAVDVPPHQGLGGRAAGEFVARSGPRWLAGISFVYCLVVGAATMALAARRPYEHATLVILPLMLLAIAGVGLAVRRAHVIVGADGIRWGWPWLGVRLDVGRLVGVAVYADAIAFEPRRGSTWFLSARDWDRFAGLARAVERAGLPVTHRGGPAPLRARLQSYGRVLDSLMVVVMLVATGALASLL
jgi:hypothetical protein